MQTEHGFLRLGNCQIDDTARICWGAVLGKPFRPLLDGDAEATLEPTVIGPNTYVGYYAVVGSGSVLSSGAIVDDYCSIESEVKLGDRSLVIYRAQICNEARVGRDCVIGGFVAERVVIGDRARVFGKIVHSQRDPSHGWDAQEAIEPSAVVEAGAFVGFDALVIGEIVVGAKAYVCAGAIVTRNVPAGHVAHGVNKIVPIDEWNGALARSRYFAHREDALPRNPGRN